MAAQPPDGRAERVSAQTPPLWTAAQQSWLQAMGYTVFVDGSVAVEAMQEPPVELSAAPAETFAAVTPRAVQPAQVPAAAETAPPRPAAPRSVDAPASGEAPAAGVPRERGGSARRSAVRMPDRLQIALLRASGCNPAAPETQSLMASWNLDEIRGNAAAKRALWPQLRALRKQGRT